jgi:hypothetical protein
MQNLLVAIFVIGAAIGLFISFAGMVKLTLATTANQFGQCMNNNRFNEDFAGANHRLLAPECENDFPHPGHTGHP